MCVATVKLPTWLYQKMKSSYTAGIAEQNLFIKTCGGNLTHSSLNECCYDNKLVRGEDRTTPQSKYGSFVPSIYCLKCNKMYAFNEVEWEWYRVDGDLETKEPL